MNASELETAILGAHKEALCRLRKSEEHCDLTLRCTIDGEEFKVHKAIVCAQSGFFQKACKPDSFKEGKDSVVDLTIGSPFTIALLLDFLYDMSYPDLNPDDNLIHDVNLYIAADFYDVPILKRVATNHFKNNVNELTNVERCLVPVTEIVYNETATTDRTLRELALAVVVANASDLLKPQDQNAGPTHLAEIMKAIPELGVDVARGLALEVEKLKSAAPTKDRVDDGW
ncbi:hypothetical protein EG328_008006 [Venturia inaequalis]|uniref:BTB domain-containing protein n=1 Tax=Venturia inaequalis TaxID=5025 RepID=A0A8H3ZA66_VENIN|nr:hypothetical protein EG328_008006 [Venturia inaequalis]